MNTSIPAIRLTTLRVSLPMVLALGVFAVMSANAHADDYLPEVTISAPAVKTVDRDRQLDAPVQEASVTGHVTFDPVTLTLNSGVALLKDSVLEAAQKACYAADPSTMDDGTCVREAVKAAQPQVDAAIARARSSANS